MHITTVTEPLFLPVSVAEVYEHLRWDTEFAGSPLTEYYPLENTVLRNIQSATDYVERYTRRSLVERTLRVSVAKFPSSANFYRRRVGDFDAMESGGAWIELPGPPLVAVTAVEYYDVTNALAAISPTAYFVAEGIVPKLQFTSTFSPPTTYVRDDAVRVTYRAGYAPSASPAETQAHYAANIPSRLKDAVMLQVQLLSDRFEVQERAAIERTRDALLSQYLIHSV